MAKLTYTLLIACCSMFLIEFLIRYGADGTVFITFFGVSFFYITGKYLFSDKGIAYAWRQIKRHGYKKFFCYSITTKYIYKLLDISIINGIGFLFIMLISAHIYMGVIILLNNNFKFGSFLQAINKNMYFLICNWPSFQKTSRIFYENGFGHRLDLIKHSYIIALIISIIIIIYLIYNNIFYFNKSIYPGRMRYFIKKEYRNLNAVFLFNGIIELVFFLIIVNEIINAEIPVKFPGRPAPIAKKYAFLLSHAHVNDVSLYSLLYVISVECFLATCIAIGLFKKIYFYFKKIR